MSELNDRIYQAIRELTPEGISLEIPPKLFTELGIRFVKYEAGRSLVCAAPAGPRFANALGMFQGAMMGAVLEGACGCLAFLSARRPCVTVTTALSYIKPLAAQGQEFVAEARLSGKGRGILFLESRVMDGDGKMLATSKMTMTPYRDKDKELQG